MSLAASTIETEALVLRRTDFREADWIVTLFTRDHGKISALARGGRKSKHRFAGGLEAFHDLTIQLRATRNDELMHLTDTNICRARHNLTAHLLAMQAAGKALNWIRSSCQPKLVDRQAWGLIQQCLDTLDMTPPSTSSQADTFLADFGLKLLNVLGWSLEFKKCVKCDKPCPPHSPAYVSPRDGGVVCRACGGHGPVLNAALRNAMSEASLLGDNSLATVEGTVALSIVERALMSHAGIE